MIDNKKPYEILKVGQIVKNYKEMCALLEESATTGKSRQLQLKDWKRYFDYEKDGQKFIISEIYDKPLPKEDERKRGNNSVYIDYIMYLLMYHFANSKSNTEYFYKVQLYKLLGMVNNNYSEHKSKEEKEIIINSMDNVSKYDYFNFYQRVPPKLEKILFSFKFPQN